VNAYETEDKQSRRWHKIYCFDCKRTLPSKSAAARSHRGHDVDYLNENGERMD